MPEAPKPPRDVSQPHSSPARQGLTPPPPLPAVTSRRGRKGRGLAAVLPGAARAGGHHELVERDFEREYGKLQQLEEQTKKLQKDMKKSTDADLAMSKAAVKISSDLLSNPLCEQDAAFLGVVTAFDTAMRRMDSFNQEKVNQIQKTVIEPLKNTASEVPWSGPAHSPKLLYGRRNAPQCSFPHAKASSCGAVPWGCVMGLCHGAVPPWGCAMGLCYGAVP
ncbi:bridging integrator 3 isoform X11 [Gallus gallus]|uniref:bridging integrator 3 isoform X11 n=1 Tax=Gallus gallus TaxID=9031 RepID=UPI001AE9998B|nr:bridging integrator 3 isoform X11 [Gallus gallus]